MPLVSGDDFATHDVARVLHGQNDFAICDVHAAIRVAYQPDLIPIALGLGVLADLAAIVGSTVLFLVCGKREPGRALLYL